MKGINKEALFHDGSLELVIPLEPEPGEKVRIFFRTAKDDVDRVLFCEKNRRYQMFKSYENALFSYYEVSYNCSDEIINYHFLIEKGDERCFFDMSGPTNYSTGRFDFRITPGFHTPDWAKGAVMYQIFVDRFYNGDKSNDVLSDEYYYIGDHTVKVDDWDKYPASMGVREFYGGDLQGVLDKLDYLEKLGVEVIYFNPLFVSPSNHKYDIQDYDYIDPHFGKIVHDEGELLQPGETDNQKATRYIDRVTNKENLEASNEFFIKVVEEIHNRGMKVILDGVFNHCGSFNKWLDKERIYEHALGYEKGAYVDKESPYHSFFRFGSQQWPYNNSYDGWWGFETLPKLNYEESEELYDYIMGIARKWVSPPYNVDGWRLDVAADLGYSQEFNHRFWRDFRRIVKEANPEAVIIAEHYGDPREWLKGDQWDTVMNYDAFMEPVSWFLTGMEKHSDSYQAGLLGNVASFKLSMKDATAYFEQPSLLVAMNELSNHDHSRFLTRTNHVAGRTATLGPEAANQGIDVGILKEAVIMQMTWPGAPTIYYGEEAGVCGWTDPDSRRTYPWGHEDLDLLEFYRDAIALHKNYLCLRIGSFKPIYRDQNGMLSYARMFKGEVIVVVINQSEEEYTIDLPVWQAGGLDGMIVTRIMQTNRKLYNIGHIDYKIYQGNVTLDIAPCTANVYFLDLNQKIS